MISLLLPRSAPAAATGSISRCLASTRRNFTVVAAAASSDDVRAAARPAKNSSHRASSSPCHQHHRHHPHNTVAALLRGDDRRDHRGGRWFSKYASVDHSAAYREAMDSPHGTQLQLALEEGRGKDVLPFDPFSEFLDGMGRTDGLPGGEDEYDEEGEVIEEAEYKTIEEFDEDELSGDEGEDEPIYTNTGSLYRPKSERLALRAGYPAGGKFAVVHMAGFQHKVAVDDLLVVNKLKPVSQYSVGSTHTIRDGDVLLMADQDRTLVGIPGVQGAEVDVMVEEITRDKTLVIFKKRRRKHSRRKNGFRRQVTFLRVLDVRMPGEEASRRAGEGVDEGQEVESVAA